jgi:hypothetical protein
MATIKKNIFTNISEKEIDELVNADGYLIGDNPGSDIPVSNDTEISTNTLKLKYADKSIPTTGDDVRNSIRQPIPFPYNVWAGRTAPSARAIPENKQVLSKNKIEEVIDDLVKKSDNDGLTKKNFDDRLEKILKLIDGELNDEQLETIAKKIVSQMEKPKNIK